DRREPAPPGPADQVRGEGAPHTRATRLLRDHQAAGGDVAAGPGPVGVHVRGPRHPVAVDGDDDPGGRVHQPDPPGFPFGHRGVVGERPLLGDDVVDDRPDPGPVVVAGFADHRVTAAQSSGTTASMSSRSTKSASSSYGVGSRLTITSIARACTATVHSDAAGSTCSELPMARNSPLVASMFRAFPMTPPSSTCPNRTTSSFRIPPQRGHAGSS